MIGKPENEAVFYARIGDYAGFEQAADHETHEQWEYKIPVGEDGVKKGRSRVRATARGEEVSYAETIKAPGNASAGMQSAIEHTVAIDKDHFDVWKQTFGTKGCFKGRYVFLSKSVTLTIEGEAIILPEIKYEVDVFMNPAGEKSKWCKIDIELDHILEYLSEHHPEIKSFDLIVTLSSLPIKLEDAFSAKDMDEEHQTAVDTLWDKFAHPLPPPPAVSRED